MSKRFKPQDYFRYKKLGKRWRKPVGWQSKLRLRKGGSGMRVSIGYGTANADQATLVKSVNELRGDFKFGIVIATSVGSRKASDIAARAKELGITIINMKKVRKAKRIAKEIEKNKKSKKTEKKSDDKKMQAKHTEKKEEHKATSEHKHEGDLPHEEHAHEDHEHKHEEHKRPAHERDQ